MSRGNLIVGAGGHGKVVADALLAAGMKLLGFLDDDLTRMNQVVLGYPVLASSDKWTELNAEGLVIGVGNNHIRQQLQEKIKAIAWPNWIKVIHPRAVVAQTALVGVGTVVMAGAIINPDAVIGEHAIINTGATVDHDCTVGKYVHIAPGVHLAGEVSVGDSAFIGIGSVVLPGCRIGKNAVIGAGAVVINDVPDDVVAKGIPARWDE